MLGERAVRWFQAAETDRRAVREAADAVEAGNRPQRTVGWSSKSRPRRPDIDALQARFPVVTRAITEYFATSRTADDLDRDVARLVLPLPDEPR